MNRTPHAPSDANLAALANEATCLSALIRAGYALEEASRWLEAWAGPRAERLWRDATQGNGTLPHAVLSTRAQRRIL